MKTGEDHGKEPREQLLIQAMVTASANSSSLGSEALLDGGSFGPCEGGILLDRANKSLTVRVLVRVLVLVRKSPTTS